MQHFHADDCSRLIVFTGYSARSNCIAISSPGRTVPDQAQEALLHPNQIGPNNPEDINIVPSLESTFSTLKVSDKSQSRKRFNFANALSSLSHHSSSGVQISTIIYGGQTINDPSVLARATDYAHTQETFTIGNEFFAGDPFYGLRKWAFIAYKSAGDEEGGDGKMRFMVGWEGDNRILGDYHLSSSDARGEVEVESGGGQDGGVKLHAIAWGGKLINDAAVVERLLDYAKSGDVFTVGNDLFGSDPDFGRLKYGIIAYKCVNEGPLKYFVGWEGERRTLGSYGC